MTSALFPGVVAVVDLDEEKVVWALARTMWRVQHQPTILDNGHILLFDNNGNHGYSKVVEIDPFTQELEWVYEGGLPEQFYSPVLGSAERLPNGNSLIAEYRRLRPLTKSFLLTYSLFAFCFFLSSSSLFISDSCIAVLCLRRQPSISQTTFAMGQE